MTRRKSVQMQYKLSCFFSEILESMDMEPINKEDQLCFVKSNELCVFRQVA
jgi:hypothetical protein